MIVEKLSGKNVFITGVTGFLGKIIVEKLLRSVPTIGKIFILIRTKKNQPPADRLNKLMSSRIFNRLRSERKDATEFIFKHLDVISGDITMDRLGMSDEDLQMVKDNINVFIHSAATINFNEPLVDAVNQNVLGTLRLFSIAQESKNLVAFTHISTAYVNCIKRGVVEEILYPLDFDPEEMLQTLLSKSPDQLAKLTSNILGEYPNTYTFTKSLTEHLLVRRRGNIPLVIFRPTIIGASYKEPVPGWLDSISAASALYVTVGVGVMKFMLTHQPDQIGDQVPADLVSNGIIAATADIAGEDRFNILHMGTSKDKPLTMIYVKKTILPYLLKRPPRRTFSKPGFFFVNSDLVYNSLYFLQFRVPIAGYNIYTALFGSADEKKQASTWMKLEQRVRGIVGNFSYFINNEWIFETSRNYLIMEKMSEEEREIFFFDAGKIDWEEYLMSFCYGMKINLLREYDTVLPLEDRHCPVYLRDDFGSDLQWAFSSNEDSNDIYFVSPPEKINRSIISCARVQAAISKDAIEEGVSRSEAEKRARDIIRVMVGSVNLKIMRPEGYLFRKFYRHMYTGIFVDEWGLRKLHQVAAKGPIILIPSHRSYIDFLITSFVMHDNRLPLPRIAAGDDFLNMFFVNWVFRNSGAFFMRRSFSNDRLYKTIFSEYVQQILSHGHPLEFFIEGTRSRSGKSLSPKLGLLSVVADAVFEDLLEHVSIIPISISYDRVVEEESHAGELLGETKSKPSTSALIKASFTKLRDLNLGRVSFQVAEPINVRDYLANDAVQKRKMRRLPAFTRPYDISSSSSSGLDELEEKESVQRKSFADTSFDPASDLIDRWEAIEELGYEVINRIHKDSVVMSTNIVATILSVYRNGISLENLSERYGWLVSQITRRGSRVDPIQMSNHDTVEHALSLLAPCVTRSREVVKILFEKDRYERVLQLCFYRNGLLHIFQREGIAAVTLLSFRERAVSGVPLSEFVNAHEFLSNLLFEEFVDYDRLERLDDTLAVMDATNMISLEKNRLTGEDEIKLTFGAGQESSSSSTTNSGSSEILVFLLELFWPFIDSYWIAAASLFALQPSNSMIDRVLVDRMQWFADQSFFSSETLYYESCSKDSLRNALRLFRSWGVLTLNHSNSFELGLDFQDEEPLHELIQRVSKYRKLPHQSLPVSLPKKPYFPDFARL